MNELFWKLTTVAQQKSRTEVRRPSEMVLLRGDMSKKSTFFKELTPRSQTYELRGQGGKKKKTKFKTNKHLTLSYKIYFQKDTCPLK